MSETIHTQDTSTRFADPYAAAAHSLLVSPHQQAELVWQSLHALADTTLIDERSETNLHAVVQMGMNVIPVRDFVMGTIAFLEDEQARPYLLALSACVGTAPIEYRGHVAASLAMLSAAFDVDRPVIERLIHLGEGTSLAQLVRNGLDMRAPANLYRLSMQHVLPEIVRELEQQQHQ